MTTEQVKEILEKAKLAAEVSQKWKTDHNDTYVAAQKIPEEHDWYWICGSMETVDDGYNAAVSDEDYRGPKEVIQAACRHVASSNPAAIIQLCEAYLDSIEALKWYANWDWSDKYVQAVSKRAKEFLKKHEVLDGREK